MTQIFLGYPPEHIKNWIIEHSKPAGNPKTKITFTDGDVEEYNWSGEITQQMMVDAGLLDNNNPDIPTWIKKPQTVEIGTNVTSIGKQAFFYCTWMTGMTIPSSVTSIGMWALTSCYSLMSVTFSGKDKATVQGMANYNSWGLNSGCVIHCADGDITL